MTTIKDNRVKINDSNLIKGSIFKMPLSEEEGITPKDGQAYRNKYFVVVGFTSDGNVAGVIIINSNINKYNYAKGVYTAHYPLKSSEYKDIFSKNCFANCTAIKPVLREKICEYATYAGKLKERDFELVYEHIVNSEIISIKDKKRYNIHIEF
jgi:hypothetical protein